MVAFLCAACTPQSSDAENVDDLAVENLIINDSLPVAGPADDSNMTMSAEDVSPSRSAPPSASAELPSFDTTAYCRNIGDTAGGSMQIEATCRDMEDEALSELRRMTIPSRMLNYCTEIGETAGGSYQIMKTCVEMESEAAARL